jgi:hypothetical protein
VREVRNCLFSNRYSCCGEPFKKKLELETHLSQPAREGMGTPGVPDAGKDRPVRGVYAPYKVGWTTFANGTAVCGLNGKDGHPGTGADSNGNLDAINFAIDKSLEVSNFVIFDGVTSSQELVNHLMNHSYPNLAVLWVFLDVSADTVLTRLLARRKNNGKAETPTKPSGVSFSIRTHGNSCRMRATSSPRRVCSFSASSSVSRAASHSFRVPTLCPASAERVCIPITSLAICLSAQSPPPEVAPATNIAAKHAGHIVLLLNLYLVSPG